MQTQIARLHPPPPVKSIIRRRSPACGLLLLGRERERGDRERWEGGAGGGIAFDSCYFSDWRGLAGKATWYKGWAQQGWSVPVCACNAAVPSGAPARFQCNELAGLGVQGQRGCFGASPARLPARPQDTPARWLTRVQAAASSVPILPAGSPGLSLLVPQVWSWGHTLTPPPHPCTAHLHPHLWCSRWLLQSAAVIARSRACKDTHTDKSEVGEGCVAAAATLVALGNQDPWYIQRERRKSAQCQGCPRGARKGEPCIHPQVYLCLPPSFPQDRGAGKLTESPPGFLQAPSPASTHPHPRPRACGCPSPHRHVGAEPCPCPCRALHLSLWLLVFSGALSPSSGDA